MEMINKLIVVLSLLISLGCQGNDPFDREANPYPDYMKNYQKDQPEARDQQTVKVKTYDVSVNGEVDSTKILHFVAGENTEYTINARSFVDQTQFTLKPNNLPEGAKLTADAKTPGSWIISWQPTVDVIPSGQQGVDFDVSIEFVISEGSSARAKNAHAPFEKMTKFRLTVRHSDQQPVITTANSLNDMKSLNEADGQVNFVLTVVDPKSNGNYPPSLEEQLNLQASELPANFALRLTAQPEHKGSGKWDFPLTLDLALLGDHYRRNGENGKLITVNLSLKAESTATENESPVWVKQLSVQLMNKESN